MNSINDIWAEILNILSRDLTPTAIKTWFEDCTPVEINDSSLVICAKNEFTKNIISTRFGESLKKALFDIFSCDMDFVILAGEEDLQNYYERQPADEGPFPAEMAGFTFDRFIVGDSNRFAFAAANAVAKQPGGKNYNPLYI